MKKTSYCFDETTIEFSINNDVLVNATDLARAVGKDVNDWLKSSIYTDACIDIFFYSQSLSYESSGIISFQDEKGYWMLDVLAVQYANSLNVDLGFWLFARIKEIIKSDCQ